jgi:molybdopterin-guanine dinucleotide biosynthesis protein A
VLGVVLVGGASRRMGTDKAWIPYRGKPLAQHMADLLRGVCRQTALVGGTPERGYDRLGLPWWPDLPGLAGAGPLAGLLTALEIAPQVLLVACDLPQLDPQLLARLLRAAGDAPAAIPQIADRAEPLAAVYRRAVVPAGRASLAAGSGRMADLLQVPGARLIPGECLGTPQELARAFHNLNRPNDLELAGG